MKKILPLILIITVLAAVYFFVSKNKEEITSIKIEDREFVVADESDIHTITIKSKAYPLIHLDRGEGYWILNEKYKANPNVMSNMLAALTKMKIKYIPPRSQNEMIFKSADKVGIEIKTYDNDGNILSDFIMATNTNDESGTYCIKRGASQPYVMAMPILEGGLRNFFNQPQENIRDKTVFAFNPKDIKSIELNYLKDKPSSFLLELSNNNYEISSLGRANNYKQKINNNLAYAYFNNFDKVMSEAINNENPELNRLEGLLPFVEIAITTKDNKRFQLELYPDLDIFDKTINTRSVDDLHQIESYFVKTSGGENYIVQHRLISKCLKTIEYFKAS